MCMSLRLRDEQCEQLVNRMVAWLREHATAANCKGAVLGLSGGIDSAVAAAICRRAFGEHCLGLIMPCESDPQDERDALLVAENISLRTRTIRLDEAYRALVDVLPTDTELDPYPVSAEQNTPTGRIDSAKGQSLDQAKKLALANMKPRLRMTVLYYVANLHSYLVVGASNLSEMTVGYFTKYGDGGVDLFLLGNFVKSEVRQLARWLQLPQRIIDKTPSGGLWQGQTDEEELGFGYDVLDQYIRHGQVNDVTAARKIEVMKRSSRHKRSMPPIFDPDGIID